MPLVPQILCHFRLDLSAITLSLQVVVPEAEKWARGNFYFIFNFTYFYNDSSCVVRVLWIKLFCALSPGFFKKKQKSSERQDPIDVI